ncbi:hypothetical protein OAF54_03335 [bacterium]|nr:hypothetical protein [bacterium]
MSTRNHLRHVGWQDEDYGGFFSQDNIDYVSKQVTKILLKVMDKKVKVADKVIKEVMNHVYDTKRNIHGDIFTADHVIAEVRNELCELNKKVINIIVSHVSSEYEITQYNYSLDIWNTLYGDFNQHGLMPHSKIRIKNRHPQKMMFNMNY